MKAILEFDHFEDTEECFGEFFTRYDSKKGAVGYIGASRITGGNGSNVIDTTRLKHWECYPYYLFVHNISIAGKLMLTAKLKTDITTGWRKFNKYVNNLLGDPALDILAEGYEVTHNVTADCNSLISKPIYIRNGATLTINCDFYCEPNAAIIIEPRGKLIVNGGTLTSACPDQMWQGITVIGDPTVFNAAAQSKVEVINGGRIENAVCAIHSVDGGSILTSNAFFENNLTAIQIDPVTSIQSSTNNYYNTEFKINDNFLGNPLDFEAHIKLTGSKSVTLYGCTLRNDATLKNPSGNNGIVAFNSPLRITNYELRDIKIPIQLSRAIR